MFSESILTILLSICGVIFYSRWRLHNTVVLKLSSLSNTLLVSLFINGFGFSAIAMLFYYTYGYIADDVNYYRGLTNFEKVNFFSIDNGSMFLRYISSPFRKYLGFGLVQFHAFWGMLGIIGSLTFVYLWTKRCITSVRGKESSIKVLALLCFPNFLAWGRFYGKDSLMLVLASFVALSSYRILFERKKLLMGLIVFVACDYCIYMVRPHIAMALALPLLISVLIKVQENKPGRDPGLSGLLRFYVPAMVIGLGAAVVFLSLSRISGKDSITFENTAQTAEQVTRMGAYGGSATEIAERLDDDRSVGFNPVQIAINIFNLLFAPMPWQIRGVNDVIAFLSNVFLLLILLKYLKTIDLSDLWHRHLAITSVFLIVLLSFMAGNVGLILRQKTILLPFLFLLLFSGTEHEVAPTRNLLPKRRNDPRKQTRPA